MTHEWLWLFLSSLIGCIMFWLGWWLRGWVDRTQGRLYRDPSKR